MKSKILLPMTFGLLGLIGCTPKPVYETGLVVKEAGSVANVIESSGALFGNESVKISDPTYLLVLQTKNGLYTVDIKQGYYTNVAPNKTLEGLALAIEEGDSVRFKLTAGNPQRTDDKLFSEDKIGINYAPDVTLIRKHK
jgi:hypothetical protein